MRWSWLRMLLLGFMIAPVPLGVDAADADGLDADRAPVGSHGGHAVRSPNLYVWDEDAREARAWAAEISGAAAQPVEGDDLGSVLRSLSQLERTWMISSWATSTNEATRRMLASALVEQIDYVGSRWVLEHLQRDPSEDVRRLASAAAKIHAAARPQAT